MDTKLTGAASPVQASVAVLIGQQWPLKGQAEHLKCLLYDQKCLPYGQTIIW